jgi:predicted dehydrogenase
MAATRTALVVGAGGMGKAWAKNLKAHADLVQMIGWVDIREDAAARAADELEIADLAYAGTDLARRLPTPGPTSSWT